MFMFNTKLDSPAFARSPRQSLRCIAATPGRTVGKEFHSFLAAFSRETHGKHLGPVWQLQWIEKERGSGEERAEVLISISTDGRVTQWSIRKGFESYGKAPPWGRLCLCVCSQFDFVCVVD